MAQQQSVRDREQGQASCTQFYQVKRPALTLAFAVAGALSFWLPDVAVHADASSNLDARHAWAITVLAPSIFLFAYLVARRVASKHNFTRVGPSMLLGVWLSGGLFMTIAAMVSKSDFVGGTGTWRLVVIFMSVVPSVTYVLAAYDGSLFALLAITVGGLLILGFRSSVTLWNSAPTPTTVAVKRAAAGSRDESRAA